MKLSSLRYFVTIANLQSYTKASEHLFVSQPTLSRTVMELEEELGTKLLNREKNNLNLTEDGKLLFKEASEILSRCDRLQDMFREDADREKERSVIRVGYQSYMNIQPAYPVFNSFMKEHSNCSITVEQASVDELKEGLEGNRYDMVICLGGEHIQTENTESSVIGSNHLMLVVHETSPLAEEDEIGLMELADEDFILIYRRYAPEAVDRLIARCIMNGFSPKASEYVDNLWQALEHVGMRKGISFIQSSMKTDWVESHFKVKVKEMKDEIYETDVLLVRQSGRKSRKLDKLTEMIKRINWDPR